MSARALHPRRWRPSHAIPCDVMIAIAICAGPHRHYLGQCDQCRVGHPNCALNRTLMASNVMTPSRCDSLACIARAVNPSALSHSPASLSTYWTLPSRFCLFVVAPKLPPALLALYTALVTSMMMIQSLAKGIGHCNGQNQKFCPTISLVRSLYATTAFHQPWTCTTHMQTHCSSSNMHNPQAALLQ